MNIWGRKNLHIGLYSSGTEEVTGTDVYILIAKINLDILAITLL